MKKLSVIIVIVIAVSLSCSLPTGDDQQTAIYYNYDYREFIIPTNITVFYKAHNLFPEDDVTSDDTLHLKVTEGYYTGMSNIKDSTNLETYWMCTSSNILNYRVHYFPDTFDFQYNNDGNAHFQYAIEIFETPEPPGHLWGGCFGGGTRIYEKTWNIYIPKSLIDSIDAL